MHRIVSIALVTLAAASAAHAQPTGSPAEPSPTPPASPAPPAPAPTPAPVEVIDLDAPDRAQAEPRPAPPAARRAAADADDDRPEGSAIGIGAGFLLPADVTEPNTASVRFRLASGLTIEPIINVRHEQTKTEFMDVDSTTGQTQAVAAAMVRLPFASMGSLELVGIGAAGFDYEHVSNEGDDNDITTLGVALGWGLGIDYWITERWALSATAVNPLLDVTRRSEEVSFSDEDQTTTTLGVGATFDPTFFMMGHLYF